jgi:histidinol-phosphate aminotransferase
MSFRESYRSILPYRPAAIPCPVDLTDNTNLWGVPPAALRAIQQAAGASITRYPQAYSDELKLRLAAYLGVDVSWIVTGCGSDDVLDSAIRAFAEPGDSIAFPDPSFSMIHTFALANGLTPIPIPLTSTYDADAEAFIRSEARVIYLCSPNNPTGTPMSREAIVRVVASAKGVVLLDEAYAEFAAENCLDLLKRFDRLVITRTMSKAFGLAGLRLGYAAARPELIHEIEKSRGPYKVSSTATRAAMAVFDEDLEWVTARVAEARENRERLRAELAQRGFDVLPSAANFLLVNIPDAEAMSAKLREKGIAVRPFKSLRGIGDALRITIGPWPMLADLLTALDGVV